MAPGTYDIIGHKRSRCFGRVEHRMPAGDDVEHGLGHDRRPHIVSRSRQVGQARQDVDLRKRRCRRLDALGRRSHRFAQLDEQVVLQVFRLLLGREHFFLVLLQLGRDVPLGVLERLLADEVAGDLLALGVGDFQVVAEDRVESDLHRRDAGAAHRLGLVRGDPLLAAFGQLALRVELGVEAAANEAAVAGHKRAIVRQRRFELRPHVRTQVEPLLQLRQAAPPCGRRASPSPSGSDSSVRPMKLRSRGVARPVVTRASSRSMS